MKEIVKMPGNLLKVGDVVCTMGYRYRIITTPHLEYPMSGRERWAFQAQMVDPLDLPPGFHTIGMALRCDLMWTVEL
jgi:hypothetical protein